MFTFPVNLRPLTWHQSVEHYTGIKVEGRQFRDVEGRRLRVRCTVERTGFAKLRLSNKMRLEELSPIDEMLIFETSRMQDQLAKLPQGALGEFNFFEPDMDAFLSGWFVLNAQSLEDTWNQVRQGGYSECRIELRVGPVAGAPREDEWLWDVVKSPHLVIDSVTVSFERPAPTLAEPEQKKSSWWR